MRGDEPTATMVIDGYFQLPQRQRRVRSFAATALELTTLFHTPFPVPMLNPDGAERFQHRKCVGYRPQPRCDQPGYPEAQILKRVTRRNPGPVGFNLHDQNAYYGAGNTLYRFGVLFLAPAYNMSTRNETPRQCHAPDRPAGPVASGTHTGKVAKYDDSSNLRLATTSRNGIFSTILIESGDWMRPKQELRNFTSLCSGCF